MNSAGLARQLTPLIPATWEVGIGGSRFEASPGKNLVMPYKPGMVVHAGIFSYGGGRGRRISV
jgi:hypothetical protein